ncbi:hypothetical protein ACJZ2D_015543 [Fusarium nematophilum]
MDNGLVGTLLSTLAQHWVLVLVSLILGWLIKNRFNRGLNKYPGPLLASLTDWWRLVDVYGQRPEVTLQKLHAKHGDVVRTGPNSLSFADPAVLKSIYGLNKGYVKSDFYIVQQSVVKGHRLASLFSTTDNDFHAQFRRSVNSAKRHGFIEKNEDVEGIVAYLSKLFLYVAPVGQIPFLDLLFLKNPIYLKLSQWGLFDSTFPVAKFARARMAERLIPELKSDAVLPTSEMKKQPLGQDLLSKFIAAREARPEFMTDQLVQTMAVSMAFAGSETTAITLSAVFYYLLRNKRCYEKLQRELDAASRAGAFSDYDSGLVTFSEAQKFPYLHACIQEAFRMHPAPGLPMERIVPPQGAEIGGEYIKGGTIVGCSAWIIHNRPEIFGDDTDVYRPERWLPDPNANAEEEDKRIKKMTGMMFQFGMGSRTCIGKNISLLEIYKVVPSLLRRFEIDFQDPSKEWRIINAWFVKQADFNVRFSRRQLVQPDNAEKQD